eukprot:Mycagemm_TRINITY_DN7912_c1_g1::TRINITY_DN7912_c1_g1_i1::g.4782::m.4782 type:complete len:142 gc:universal TRINITY_DN7912_c1_g1_i1:24-449(+)
MCIRDRHLNTAWVEHDANGGAHSLRREILCELSPDDTRVAVRTSNATPDGADLRAVEDLLGAVQENNTLAKIEIALLAGVHALDLNQRGVLVLVALAALVPHEDTLAVQPESLLLGLLVALLISLLGHLVQGKKKKARTLR